VVVGAQPLPAQNCSDTVSVDSGGQQSTDDGTCRLWRWTRLDQQQPDHWPGASSPTTAGIKLTEGGWPSRVVRRSVSAWPSACLALIRAGMAWTTDVDERGLPRHGGDAGRLRQRRLRYRRQTSLCRIRFAGAVLLPGIGPVGLRGPPPIGRSTSATSPCRTVRSTLIVRQPVLVSCPKPMPG